MDRVLGSLIVLFQLQRFMVELDANMVTNMKNI
jgi:hypothetical protein